MSFSKYARLEDAEVLGIAGSRTRTKTASLDKFAEFDNYRTEDGYLYARIRAISSRVNKNHDGWPSVELAGGQDIFDRHTSSTGFTVEASEGADYGFSTFLGKPVFVDHHNHDPERARGVIVDAKLHVEDFKTAAEHDPYYSSAPENHTPPTWVELLLEVDAKSFPRLAAAIVEGSRDPHKGIDGFSMGCDVEKSVCSICKNAAYTPDDFCNHVKLKGATFDVTDDRTGTKTSRKSYEDCYGIKFFEISAVFDPADETALLRELIHKEGSTKEAIGPHQHDESMCAECYGEGALPNGAVCQNCGGTGQEQGLAPDVQALTPPEYQPPGPRVPGPAEQDYEATKFRNQLDQYGAHRAARALQNSGVPIPENLQRKLAGEPSPTIPDKRQLGVGFHECSNCGAHVRDEADVCPSCNQRQASIRTAENPLPQADLLHKPEDLDTLRQETICPVCGSTMDEESCEICGYVEPPDGFQNPDLEKAKEDPLVEPGADLQADPNPAPHPGVDGPPTGLAEPDVLRGNNPGTTAGVRDDMPQWEISLNPRIAGRINVTEKPITTSTEDQTNEPKEDIVQDETQPVTSSVRTAKDFIAAAERGKETEMSDTNKTAAEPVPAAKPKKRVDVEGVGGVDEGSNEQASKADAQVGVDGKGGTGVEGVAADQEGVNVAQGDEHSKNIEGTHTDTWSGTEGQTSPVQGETFPSEAGQGAGKWSANIHQALDSEAFPKDDGGLAGGSANQGTQPVDPSGKADDRVDVLQPVTTPANNSGPTDTWSGTGGNAVTRQQDPVTPATLEGSDIVDLSPTKSSSHIFSAVKLADLEVEVGLTDAEEKYERMAEIEAYSPETVDAVTETVEKIKSRVQSHRQARVAHAQKLPSMNGGGSSSKTASAEEGDGDDASLFF